MDPKVQDISSKRQKYGLDHARVRQLHMEADPFTYENLNLHAPRARSGFCQDEDEGRTAERLYRSTRTHSTLGGSTDRLKLPSSQIPPPEAVPARGHQRIEDRGDGSEEL